MKKRLPLICLFIALGYTGFLSAQTQCTLGNYSAMTFIHPGNLPYTSPGTGIVVNVSAPGVPTLGNFSYSCGAQSFACASPTWWPNSTAHIITITFSQPVAKFGLVINGTNQGEVFTFNGNTGTTTLSDYCTAGFSTVAANQLIDNIVPATGTVITVNNSIGATSYVITHNGTGSGSRLSFLDCIVPASPFAVSMNEFEAQYRQELRDVALTWSTSREENALGFEVQHSTDGQVWDILGWVDAAGTSTALQNYAMPHANPASGPNHYRIRQVDQNGADTYTEVRTVEVLGAGMEAIVFPNPSSGVFEVRAAGRVGTLDVTDLLGKRIHTQAFESATRLDLSQFSVGTYLLRITDQHRRTTVQRIAVN